MSLGVRRLGCSLSEEEIHHLWLIVLGSVVQWGLLSAIQDADVVGVGLEQNLSNVGETVQCCNVHRCKTTDVHRSRACSVINETLHDFRGSAVTGQMDRSIGSVVFGVGHRDQEMAAGTPALKNHLGSFHVTRLAGKVDGLHSIIILHENVGTVLEESLHDPGISNAGSVVKWGVLLLVDQIHLNALSLEENFHCCSVATGTGYMQWCLPILGLWTDYTVVFVH